MDRGQKAQEISSIADKFSRAKAAFLVDYKGMNVEQVTSLRKKLRGVGAEMRVVRNTLALRALTEYPQQKAALEDSLVGTNAFVFVFDEVSGPAKTLADFGKDVELLQLKGGVLEGKKLDQEMIKYLATLPSKDVLRAQLLGVFAAPMSKFLGQLQAPTATFARLLGAYKSSKETETN